MQTLPSKTISQALFGTVVQKLSFEVFSQGRMSMSIPGFCGVLLSNGRGLGRSLSYVGRSQVSLFMILHGSVVHKLPFAAASEAFAWNRRAEGASQRYLADLGWNCCTKVALRSYFLSFCMELSCKSYLAGLFLKLWSCCMELSCKSCLTKLFLKLLHGTVMHRLPFKATPQAFVWRCRAKTAFWNYFFSFCMELSCRGCLSKLFLKLLYEGVVQKLPFETISSAFVWNCRAKALSLFKILFSISRLLRRAFE